MKLRVAPDVRLVVDAVEILDDRTVRIAGDEVSVPPSHASAAPRATSLATELYERVYIRPRPEPELPPSPLALRRHLAALCAANGGTGSWEPDWRLVSAGEGAALASRLGAIFRVPSDCLRDDSGLEAGCRVRVPGESQWLLPGYYLARGNAAARSGADLPTVLRLYWHLRPAGAAQWIHGLTSRLNRRRIPFTLKAVRDPRRYRRADAGVLYLDPESYAGARREILRTWRDVRDELRPEVPLFTLPLAPGLGLAEGTGQRSFGEERCELMATALLAAFARGGRSPADQLADVVAAFRAVGLNPDRPHLSAGSTRRYRRWTEAELLPPGRTRASRTNPHPSFEDAAQQVADRLCRHAIWYGDACNWIGRSTGGDQWSDTTAALPTELYQGTSGIGVFLAEIAARTGEPHHRRTAVGAVRQALMSTVEPTGRSHSFYCGLLGIAWAARRVAVLTGDGAIEAAAWQRLARLTAPTRHGPMDVINGHAGAIPALLDLHRQTDEDGYFYAAVRLGREMLDASRAAANHMLWDNATTIGWGEDDPPLTGLAHGAAGLGRALIELFGVTSERDFLLGARGAFAYEDALFDPERGNWPDLRDSGNRREAVPHFRTAWCHGAPGIILSRLRALRIDPAPEPAYATFAKTGLRTTRRALQEGLASRDTDTSLCHGLCGLIDVMLLASEALGDSTLDVDASNALEVLFSRHAATGAWPSGVRSRGHHPSLLLGQAGLGYTLLRMADRTQGGQPPSVLLLHDPRGDETSVL